MWKKPNKNICIANLNSWSSRAAKENKMEWEREIRTWNKLRFKFKFIAFTAVSVDSVQRSVWLILVKLQRSEM